MSVFSELPATTENSDTASSWKYFADKIWSALEWLLVLVSTTRGALVDPTVLCRVPPPTTTAHSMWVAIFHSTITWYHMMDALAVTKMYRLRTVQLLLEVCSFVELAQIWNPAIWLAENCSQDNYFARGRMMFTNFQRTMYLPTFQWLYHDQHR